MQGWGGVVPLNPAVVQRRFLSVTGIARSTVILYDQYRKAT